MYYHARQLLRQMGGICLGNYVSMQGLKFLLTVVLLIERTFKGR